MNIRVPAALCLVAAAFAACADEAPWARYVAAISAEKEEPPRAFVDPAERLGAIYGVADEGDMLLALMRIW